MAPDLDTLREMWRYHMGRAYWQAHPRRTLGVYDQPRHRIEQYTVYGVTNLLLPATALALAHDIYGEEKFQALAVAGQISLVVDSILYLLAAVGVVMSLTALRLLVVHCRNGDTDRCDPFRWWAMFRAYRWAKAQRWIHEVDGRLIFDRRMGEDSPPPQGLPERRASDQALYPTDRREAPAIVPRR